VTCPAEQAGEQAVWRGITMKVTTEKHLRKDVVFLHYVPCLFPGFENLWKVLVFPS